MSAVVTRWAMMSPASAGARVGRGFATGNYNAAGQGSFDLLSDTVLLAAGTTVMIEPVMQK